MATVAFITEDGASHRPAYQQAIRDVDLIERAVLVDSDGATFDETQQVCGEKVAGCETSIDSMLETVRPDMAIVTMKGAHAPPVIRPLLEAGIHVLAEKPACVDPDDFADLAVLAGRKGVHLMLAFAQRLHQPNIDACRIVADGEIGELYAVQATQVDDQARIQRRLDRGDWTFIKALAGGGHLSWLGIHTVDQIRFLTGLEVEAVSAMTPVVGGTSIDVEDLATVSMRFAGGAHGALFSGYLMPEKGHSSMTVYGSEGWVRLNAAERGQLEWRRVGSPKRVISYSGHAGGYTPWVERTLQACLGQCEPPLAAADGLAALQIVHAAYRSSETGRTVEIARS